MAELIVNRVSSYAFIIWDWNGTLINDARIGTMAEGELFRRYGLPVQTHEERLRNMTMPIENYYARMGFDFSKVSYEKIAEEWLSIYESLVKTAPLFEGSTEMLDGLRSQGKRMFVLSAAPEAHLHEMVHKHSIAHFFEGIYGLPNARAESKIERGLELMRAFQIDPTSTIMIGDTVHDYEVGKALGVDILLIGDGHHAVDSLLKVHDNVLRSRFGGFSEG